MVHLVTRGVTSLEGARGKKAPGAKSKFGAPLFAIEVFRKQMFCTEESACDIVGTFRGHPQ